MKKILLLVFVLIVALTFTASCKKSFVGSITIDIQKTINEPDAVFSINIVIHDNGSEQGYQITAESNHSGRFDEDMTGTFDDNAEWYIDDITGKYIYYKPDFDGNRARKDVIIVRVVNYDNNETYEASEQITVIPD